MKADPEYSLRGRNIRQVFDFHGDGPARVYAYPAASAECLDCRKDLQQSALQVFLYSRGQ